MHDAVYCRYCDMCGETGGRAGQEIWSSYHSGW